MEGIDGWSVCTKGVLRWHILGAKLVQIVRSCKIVLQLVHLKGVVLQVLCICLKGFMEMLY